MLGSLGGGQITTRLGYKKVLFIGSVLAGAATIWTMVAYAYAEQIVARVIAGLGIGLISSAAPPYVTAMCQEKFPEKSGTLGCLFQGRSRSASSCPPGGRRGGQRRQRPRRGL